MTRKRNRRPQQRTFTPAAERNYRDANVNFPSTLADNVSSIRASASASFSNVNRIVGIVVNKQNRFRQAGA